MANGDDERKIKRATVRLPYPKDGNTYKRFEDLRGKILRKDPEAEINIKRFRFEISNSSISELDFNRIMRGYQSPVIDVQEYWGNGSKTEAEIILSDNDNSASWKALKTAREQWNQAEIKAASLRDELSQLEDEYEFAAERVTESEKENAALEERVDCLEKQILTEIEKREKQQNFYENKLNQVQDELGEQREAEEWAKNVLNEAGVVIEGKGQSYVKELVEYMLIYEKTIGSYEVLLEQRDKKVKELNKGISAHRKENEDMAQTLKGVRKALKKSKKREVVLEDRIKRLNSNLTATQREDEKRRRKSEEQIAVLEQEKANLSEKLSDAEEDRDFYRDSIEFYEKDAKVDRRQLAVQEERIERAEKEAKYYAEKLNELDDLQADYELVSGFYDALLKTHQRELAVASDNTARANALHQRGKVILSRLSVQKSINRGLNKQILELKNSVRESQARVKDLKSKLLKSCTETNKLRGRCESMQIIYDQLQEKLKGYEAEFEAQKSRTDYCPDSSAESLLRNLLIRIDGGSVKQAAEAYEELFNGEPMPREFEIALIPNDMEYVLSVPNIVEGLTMLQINVEDYDSLEGILGKLDEEINSKVDDEVKERYELAKDSLSGYRTQAKMSRDDTLMRRCRLLENDIDKYEKEKNDVGERQKIAAQLTKRIKEEADFYESARDSKGYEADNAYLDFTVKMFAYFTEDGESYIGHTLLPFDSSADCSAFGQHVYQSLFSAFLDRTENIEVSKPGDNGEVSDIVICYKKSLFDREKALQSFKRMMNNAREAHSRSALNELGIKLNIDESFMEVGLK